MIKKILGIGIVAVVAGFLLLGTGFGSYVGTAMGIFKEKIRGSIPTEFEIRRAENMIAGIVPEIQACKKVVAEEEVAVDYLESEIRELAAVQTQNRKKIDIQRVALERGESYYHFGGHRYSRAALEVQLERSFDEFTQNETLVETKNRLLESRLQSLEAAKVKLEQVRLEKSRLENQVQNLYAQLRQVEAMEANATHFTLDDSKLARAKELLARCKKRLDVAQKMIENDREILPEIDISAEGESRDIVSEVARYFAEREGRVDPAASVAQASKPSL